MEPLDRLSRRELFTGSDDLVFAGVLGGHLDGSALRRRFYAALDRAGLGALRAKPEPITFHDLRHTFGTLAVRAFPLSDVKAYMGHSDIQTTMIYVHHVPRHDARGETVGDRRGGDGDRRRGDAGRRVDEAVVTEWSRQVGAARSARLPRAGV
jgi:integrase